MKNLKISFLIPAHNEEKIIAKPLENLLKLPYNDYEVLIGLDGCTDNTENIVKDFCKKSKKFRYYKLNLRQGKPVVINSIIKHAKEDIIIINDADWIFKVRDKETFEKFLSVFEDSKVGGIAESYALEWKKNKMIKGNIGYKMVAYSSQLWFNFQKKNFTITVDKSLKLMKIIRPTMFLTNIFIKKLYKTNYSLGDDFERTYNIFKKGYDIVLFDEINMPRMIAVYDNISLKDLFKQKVRTAIAREQLKSKQKLNLKNYYFPAVRYILKNSWKYGYAAGFMIILWIFLTTIATIIGKFKTKNISTKEGWKLRMLR